MITCAGYKIKKSNASGGWFLQARLANMGLKGIICLLYNKMSCHQKDNLYLTKCSISINSKMS